MKRILINIFWNHIAFVNAINGNHCFVHRMERKSPAHFSTSWYLFRTKIIRANRKRFSKSTCKRAILKWSWNEAKYYQPSNICSFPSWKHQNCTGPWLKWQKQNLLHMTFIGFALAVLDDVCSSLAVCESVLECANIILLRIKRSNCSQMASCTFGSHWASSVKLWLFQRTEWSTKLMCSVAQDVKCAIFVEDSKALE